MRDRLDHIKAKAPRLFRFARIIGRMLIAIYWRVREILEISGNFLNDKLFSPISAASRAFFRRVRVFPTRFSCVLSFMGLMPRLARDPDPSLIVMVAVADLRHDPRIEREARALAAAGFRVIIVAPTVGNYVERQLDWGPGVSFDLASIYASHFVAEWPGFIGDELFVALLRHRPLAIHAHDLDMAFIAFAAARRTGAKVVCDFHEWYSENVTYNAAAARYEPHRRLKRMAYRWLERYSLLNADAVVTVCDSIADAMATELGNGRRPEVVRNIPSLTVVPTRTYRPLKQELSIAEDRFVLLYQGGLGPSRLIEPIVEALAHAPACTLVIRGPHLENWGRGYAAIAARIGANDRLVLAPAVPSRDVVEAGRGADAAIYTVLGVGRNFIYALPNKVFEYMASGLPLLVADYPEVARLVSRYEVGLTFQPDDPRSIAQAINALIEDGATRARMVRNTQVALTQMDAAGEWQRIAIIHQRLRDSGMAKGAA